MGRKQVTKFYSSFLSYKSFKKPVLFELLLATPLPFFLTLQKFLLLIVNSDADKRNIYTNLKLVIVILQQTGLVFVDAL